MKILIPILVGAIIGYCTNWLAIKMVFKPIEEKKILGIKLPFTPGLIPKERYRIAKSVGQVVGENLLSRDKIANILSSNDSREKINKLFLSKIEENKNNSNTLNDIIGPIGEEKILEKKSQLKNFIYGKLIKKLEDNDFKENMLKSIDYDFLIGDFIEKVNTQNKTIIQILPGDINKKIPIVVEENREYIIEGFRQLIGSEDTSYKIKAEIEDFLDNNLGKMLTMFIGIESISEKVINGINKYVHSKKGEENILEITNSMINKAMELEVNSLSSLFDSINKGEVEKFGNKFLMEKIDELIKSLKFQQLLMGNIEKFIENILNMEVGKIISLIDIDKLEENINGLYEISSKSIENLIIELVNLFDISKIVEEEINGFEIEYTEKLILDIADRELKAITRLGALLGGILGLLSPLLQNI